MLILYHCSIQNPNRVLLMATFLILFFLLYNFSPTTAAEPRVMTKAEKDAFYANPWDDPLHRLGLWYHDDHCRNYSCATGLVCARLGNSKGERVEKPESCAFTDELCELGKVSHQEIFIIF